GLGDGIDVPLVLVDQLVAHGEAALRVDGALLGHQVADVAVRGQDLEVLAEVLVDRLGLGGRLDDEQVLGHAGEAPGRPARGRQDDAARGGTRAGVYFIKAPARPTLSSKGAVRGPGRGPGPGGSAAVLGQVAEQGVVGAAAEAAVLIHGQPDAVAGRLAHVLDLAQVQLDGAAAVFEGADDDLLDALDLQVLHAQLVQAARAAVGVVLELGNRGLEWRGLRQQLHQLRAAQVVVVGRDGDGG